MGSKIFVFILSASFSLNSLASSDWGSFDRMTFRLALESCKSAKIGNPNRLQKWDAWFNRVGHTNPHHNSDEDTYVSINASAFKTRLKEAGPEFFQYFPSDFATNVIVSTFDKSNPPQPREVIESEDRLEKLAQSEGFQRALQVCFPQGCRPPEQLKKIRHNFTKEFYAQLRAAEMSGAALSVAGYAGVAAVATAGIKLGSKGLSKAGEFAHRKVSQISPRVANSGRRVAPSSSTIIVGAIAAPFIIKALRKAYEIVGTRMTQTEAALAEGKSLSEVHGAVKIDLLAAGFQDLSKIMEENTRGAEWALIEESVAMIDSEIIYYTGELTKWKDYIEFFKDIDPKSLPGPSIEVALENVSKIETFLDVLNLQREATIQEMRNFEASLDQLASAEATAAN